MDKDLKAIVREFCNNVSESELETLTSQLTHRMQGDFPAALNFISKHRAMDQLLGSAKSAEEFFNLCDQIKDALFTECKKKGLVLTKGPVAA
jgi:hypothetical protein